MDTYKVLTAGDNATEENLNKLADQGYEIIRTVGNQIILMHKTAIENSTNPYKSLMEAANDFGAPSASGADVAKAIDVGLKKHGSMKKR